MLKSLSIEQFVLIDKLTVNFKGGLTILTGETGAGKSIMLGAMSLILGGVSNPKSIRQGTNESRFEAVFNPIQGHPVWKFLTEKGLAQAGDTEFKVFRSFNHDGQDIIKFNGKEIERELMEEIGTYLVEIHGQFANQSLMDPHNHLLWLDMSGNFEPEIMTNVSEALHNVKRYTQELEEEKTFLAKHKGREGQKIAKIVAQFDSIGMEEGFIEKLQEEYKILLTAKETSESFQSILSKLISGDGAVTTLSNANNTLNKNPNLDEEKVADLKHYLKSSLDYARKAVDEMYDVIPQYEIDTDPIFEARKKLDVLESIATENKIEFDKLSGFWSHLSKKLARIKNGQARLAELKDLLVSAKNDYRKHASILSERRMAAAKNLSKAITEELPPLKLEKAQFEVVVEEKPEMPWTELGFNEVVFTARMNPGMPFSPIAETASGGEMARMILALKVILQKVQATPTLVFDEVDTGIGGPAAAAVGDRLALLAENTQVLVITHSPQVASRGNTHLHVSKKSDTDITTSAVNELTHEQRVDEISRMLAGDNTTSESQAAAERLISEAQQAVAKRQAQPAQPA